MVHALASVYLVFNLLGVFLSAILLATSLKMRQPPVLINMYAIWVFASATSSFTCLQPHPSRSLCISQTILVTPTTSMASAAAFFLVLSVARTVFTLKLNLDPTATRIRTYIFFIMPWFIYMAFVVPLLVACLLRPDDVTKHALYCYLNQDWVAYVIGVLCGIFLLGTLLLQGWTTWAIWRNHSTLSSHGSFDIALTARVLLFSVWVTIAFVISFTTISNPTSVTTDIITATIPTAIFLIFGSQRNVLHTWHKFFFHLLPASLARRNESQASSENSLPRRGEMTIGSGSRSRRLGQAQRHELTLTFRDDLVLEGGIASSIGGKERRNESPTSFEMSDIESFAPGGFDATKGRDARNVRSSGSDGKQGRKSLGLGSKSRWQASTSGRDVSRLPTLTFEQAFEDDEEPQVLWSPEAIDNLARSPRYPPTRSYSLPITSYPPGGLTPPSSHSLALSPAHLLSSPRLSPSSRSQPDTPSSRT